MIRGTVRAAVAVVLGIVFGLLLSIFLTSCGDPEEAAVVGPDERAAARVVWRAEMRMGWESYPTISWRGGDAACGLDAYLDSALGYCIAGEYSLANKVTVVARSRISDSAYVHELMHARQWLAEKIYDPQHLSPEWSRVDEINARLRGMGL